MTGTALGHTIGTALGHTGQRLEDFVQGYVNDPKKQYGRMAEYRAGRGLVHRRRQ